MRTNAWDSRTKAAATRSTSPAAVGARTARQARMKYLRRNRARARNCTKKCDRRVDWSRIATHVSWAIHGARGAARLHGAASK